MVMMMRLGSYMKTDQSLVYMSRALHELVIKKIKHNVEILVR